LLFDKTHSKLLVNMYHVVAYSIEPVQLNGSYVQFFKITNTTKERLPANRLNLTTTDNDFYSYSNTSVPVIPPYGSVHVELRFEIKGGRTIEHVPSSYQISVGNETSSFLNKIYNFTAEFEKFGSPDNASAWNLYIYGLPGSTKSSFINTAYTIFSPDDSIANKAPVGGGGEHCTTQLHRYGITEQINIWDTWGLTPQTFHPKLLRLFNAGQVPVHYQMEKINDKKETNHIVEKYKSSAHSRSCHSIIFFIPWGSVSDDNEFEMVKSCFREFKNFCPVVVLTLVDDLEPDFRENPKGNYPKLLELRQSVAKKIGTPLHNIFLYNQLQWRI